MNYDIPLFCLNYGKEEEQAVLETIRSQWISIGPKCQEFERMFEQMLQVKYAYSLSNCTDALHLACFVLGIKPGDEVICPSLTFSATVNAIRYVGATPVFCDVKSLNDLTIDVDVLESLVTPKTKGIIPMHFAGYSCNMGSIMQIAKEHDLFVIEDACHGPLSEYNGKKLGTIGDIGCFSFFSNKNISTGEGGMIVTNNDTLASRIKLLRSHGMTTMSFERSQGHATSYDIAEIGFNFRMDDIRASLGIEQLKKLPNDLIKRQALRSMYLQEISKIDKVAVPFSTRTEFSSNYIMPIVLKDSNSVQREKVRDALHKRGIQTSVHYPAVHRFSAYQDFKSNLPVTEYITDTEITLPMYASLSDQQIKYVTDSLKEVILQIE